MAQFLEQIGANAGWLRHIVILAPEFKFDRKFWGEPEHLIGLPAGWVDFLEIIQAACPGLRTVELLSCKCHDQPFPILRTIDVAAKMLPLLHEGGFRDLSLLEKITVVCDSVDEGEYEEALEARETLMAMMPSDKWAIKFVRERLLS